MHEENLIEKNKTHFNNICRFLIINLITFDYKNNLFS